MEWQYNFGDKVFSLIQRGCLMKIKESPSIILAFHGMLGRKKQTGLLLLLLTLVFSFLTAAVISGFAWVFGGSAVLEFAFGIPGISCFLIDSMKARDYNVLQNYILIVVIWMFLVHLALHFVLLALDVRRKA